MAVDDALRSLATAMTTADGVRTRFRLGVVSSVTAGAAADGHAAVSVQVGGSTVAAPYLESYTSPTVGDTVMVLLADNSPLIIGHVIGLPLF